MRQFAKCTTGLPILLTLVANPTHAQVQRSGEQPQVIAPQSTNRPMPATASKPRLTNRFHQLRNEYGAVKTNAARYDHLRSAEYPALRQVRSELSANMREFERLDATVKNKLDSMSEISEMESLRLQMAMDRMSKLMSTLSNLLKKQSETAAAITQNMK